MAHILNTDDIEAKDILDMDDSSDASGIPFSWEKISRCFVILMVVVMVAVISWRPAMLRFSQLMFLVSPSHGDSLAWKPAPEPPSRPEPRKHTRAPSEWRLTSNNFGSWKPAKEVSPGAGSASGSRLLERDWNRFSFNPWAWRNDVALPEKRLESDIGDPVQQPLTAFRAKDGENWVQPVISTQDTVSPEDLLSGLPSQEKSSPSIIPSLSTVPLEIPTLNPVEKESAKERQNRDDPENATVSENINDKNTIDQDTQASTRLEFPTLSFDALELPVRQTVSESTEHNGIEAASDTTQQVVQELTQAPLPSTSDPDKSISESVVSEQRPDEVMIPVPESIEARGESKNNNNEEYQDWANTEITRSITGAYLTIYPKLKFIGLCVPGQGYVRKYNQVGMPKDLERPKFSAHDGRTPYGKYFIAARNREKEGPALTLSWPSLEDGERIGLPAGQLLDIENAWRSQRLPPQDTIAGGNIRLTGDRDSTEETEGGFSLEAPHMEEIFTALPDGAWVFIQP